jgi:replicative superfamily II helicase
LDEVLRNLGLRDLNRIQSLAIENGVLQGANLFVVAPSGSGKTLIGLMAALSLLAKENDNRTAVFLVPLKALARQQFDWLRHALGTKRIKVAMDTGDFSASNDKGDFQTYQLLVMTYERFDSLIRKKVWWLKRIRLVVIDELNCLAERVRGPRLEATVVRIKESMPNAQLVALCPPIGNAPQIAEWLECNLISVNERPVPLHLDVLLTRNKMESIVELCARNARQGGSVIVFAPSRSKVNQIALSLLEPLRRFLTSQEIAKCKSLSRTLFRTRDEIPNVTKKLASLVEGGVAFHHAGLRIEDRQIIEEGFRAGIIKVVACTTTLGTGINTPARMVIITDTSYFDVDLSGNYSESAKLRRIEPDRLHQMLGRAGRPGYDKVGIGVVLVGSRAEEEFVRKIYFRKCTDLTKGVTLEHLLPTIESKINSKQALLEQLLLRIYECGECDTEGLLNFLSKTLWWKSREYPDLSVVPQLKTSSYSAVELIDVLEESSDNKDRTRPGYIDREDEQVRAKQHLEIKYVSTAVKIVSISKQRIEAKVQELGKPWINCSFDFRNGAKCECDEKRLLNASGELGSPFCSHLMKVAKYLLSMPATKPYAEELIIQSFSKMLPLNQLIDDGMILTINDKYRCTELGSIATTLYLHPLTILFLKNAFSRLNTDDELDLDDMINITTIAVTIETGKRPPLINQRVIERSLAEWVSEMPEENILKTRSIDDGDFHELTEEAARLSSATSVMARTLGLAKLSRLFSVLSKRIRYGVKEDLIPLMDLSIPFLGRKLVRKLHALGYKDLKELVRAPAEELVELANLPESTVSVIKEYTNKLAGVN